MISSTTNKQVKFVNALVKKAKTRREEELFVAEGLRMCSEIPKDRIHKFHLLVGCTADHVLYSPYV